MSGRAVALSDLASGERARIRGLAQCSKAYRHKLLAMGLIQGTEITMVRKAPLGCPVQICVRGFALSLRAHEAAAIEMERLP